MKKTLGRAGSLLGGATRDSTLGVQRRLIDGALIAALALLVTLTGCDALLSNTRQGSASLAPPAWIHGVWESKTNSEFTMIFTSGNIIWNGYDMKDGIPAAGYDLADRVSPDNPYVYSVHWGTRGSSFFSMQSQWIFGLMGNELGMAGRGAETQYLRWIGEVPPEYTDSPDQTGEGTLRLKSDSTFFSAYILRKMYVRNSGTTGWNDPVLVKWIDSNSVNFGLENTTISAGTYDILITAWHSAPGQAYEDIGRVHFIRTNVGVVTEEETLLNFTGTGGPISGWPAGAID